MKPVVVRSINDDTGQRCVDVLRDGDAFGFVECRRDPEDAHGWRRLGPLRAGFDSHEAALKAARADIGWLTSER